MSKHTVSFSVQGEFITTLAREKLYVDHDMAYAVELLKSCTMTDDLTPTEHDKIVMDILEGRKRITGTYPGPTYGIVDDEPTKKTPGVAALIADLDTKIRSLQKEIQACNRQLAVIAEDMTEYDMYSANRKWHQTEYDPNGPEDESNPQWIFPDYVSSPDGTDTALLDDYMTAVDANTGNDYGWLSPTGVFTPVEWGDHQQWARQYIGDHPAEFDLNANDPCAIGGPGDRLAEKGWILLHSPHQGVARPTMDPKKRITKAQREFLYGYYIDRGLNNLADEYMSE